MSNPDDYHTLKQPSTRHAYPSHVEMLVNRDERLHVSIDIERHGNRHMCRITRYKNPNTLTLDIRINRQKCTAREHFRTNTRVYTRQLIRVTTWNCLWRVICFRSRMVGLQLAQSLSIVTDSTNFDDTRH